MIDEADEFVTGPQNKGKRPGDSSSMAGGGPKRRRCMSPLLRLGRAYTPPVTPPASPQPTGVDIDIHKIHIDIHNVKKIQSSLCTVVCSEGRLQGFIDKWVEGGCMVLRYRERGNESDA